MNRESIRRQPALWFLPALATLALAGCRQAATETSAAQAQVRPDYDKKTGQLKRLEYDSDGNGTIDTWGYMDGARVVRVEVDENGDGKVDRWEFHEDGQQSAVDSQQSSVDGRQSAVQLPAASQSVDKTIVRIERATRYDGKVSRWEYFSNGLLTRVEEDTDGNGTVDKWETYSNNVLSVMALDTTGHGRPDRRLIYRADGTLDHIEADPTGSGDFHALPQAKP